MAAIIRRGKANPGSGEEGKEEQQIQIKEKKTPQKGQ